METAIISAFNVKVPTSEVGEYKEHLSHREYPSRSGTAQGKRFDITRHFMKKL